MCPPWCCSSSCAGGSGATRTTAGRWTSPPSPGPSARRPAVRPAALLAPARSRLPLRRLLAYVRAADTGRDRYVVLGAFLSGLALLVEYTTAPAIAVTATYALFAGTRRGAEGRAQRALRRAALGLAGAAVPVGSLLWYQTVAFGGPFETGYQHLVSPTLAAISDAGFMGLHPPSPRWLAISLVAQGKGLLYFSPWLVLALPGLWLAFRRPARKAETLAVAGVLAVYLLFTSAWDPGVWGWVVGPRHLTPLIPFLAAPTAAALSRLRDRPGSAGPWLAGTAAGLVAWSILAFGLSILTYPHFPPDVAAPLFHIALPLLARGEVVDGAGAWLLHRTGPVTQLPVFVALLLSVAWPAALLPGRASPRGRTVSAALALAVVVAFGAVAAVLAPPATASAKARAFVTQHYFPKPGAARRRRGTVTGPAACAYRAPRWRTRTNWWIFPSKPARTSIPARRSAATAWSGSPRTRTSAAAGWAPAG